MKKLISELIKVKTAEEGYPPKPCSRFSQPGFFSQGYPRLFQESITTQFCLDAAFFVLPYSKKKAHQYSWSVLQILGMFMMINKTLWCFIPSRTAPLWLEGILLKDPWGEHMYADMRHWICSWTLIYLKHKVFKGLFLVYSFTHPYTVY